MAEMSNPYVAGSPLSSSAMFFGRADVFEFVKQTLARESGDHAIVLYGQRRTGKTSVLNQLRYQLDAHYLCIFIDLQMLDLNGLDGLLWQLAMNVRRGLERGYQIELPPLDRATFMADARDAFRSQFLEHVWATIDDRQLVLLVDEVVRLQEEITAGRLERDVFDYLRHLMQHYARLQFVFALGTSLAEMERDYAFLFSVGLYRKISFLERPVAEALITEPVRAFYALEPAAVARIYETTSGHPFYTQLLCQTLFNRWQTARQPRLTSDDVDSVLTEVTELGSPALKNVWDDSTLGERVVAAGLAAVIGTEGRVVRMADLARFWAERGLEISRDESALAFRSLIGRDVLVSGDRPSFSVELQRRWIEQYGRPEWVRQEVAAAQRAEAAAGGAHPVADNFRLFEPPPEPAPEAPPPEPASPPPPPGRWERITGYPPPTRYGIVGGSATLLFALGLVWGVIRGSPPPGLATETPTTVPSQAGVTPGPRDGAPAVSVAPLSGGTGPTAAPGASGSAGSSNAPPGRQPTPTPPPIGSGDALHAEIVRAADRAGIPHSALLALAEAETGRRSNAVEPASMEDAVKAWPAVYAGWARQRVALTDLAEVLPPPDEGPPAIELLERVINACLKAGPAGDRAAAMLSHHLPGPAATHDQILKALVAYRAENTGEELAAVEARDLPRFQAALTWAEGLVGAMATPSPQVAMVTPITANRTATATARIPPVSAVATGTTSTATTPVVANGTGVPVSGPAARFNRDAPTIVQANYWDDTPAVTTWMLRSIGRNVTLQEVTDEMLKQHIVSPDVGLLDGRGTGLVQVISGTWNEKAFNKIPVSFDDVAAMAGRYPVAIGGRAWTHWTGVRGFDGERLILANPGGTGPRFGQQSLNREQFDVLGPFTSVWIEP